VGGLNKIPVAVNHPWVQVFLTFGGGIALVLLALWLRDSVWHRLPLWSGPGVAASLMVALFAEGAYEEWNKSDTTVSTLKKRLIPTLWVAWDTTYRASKDAKHKWIILQVHNDGDTIARNVYVKILAVSVVFSATYVPLVPAHGARLKWNAGGEQTLNVAGRSREDLQVGIHYADYPDNWYITIADETSQIFRSLPAFTISRSRYARTTPQKSRAASALPIRRLEISDWTTRPRCQLQVHCQRLLCNRFFDTCPRR
jgi:hypothetical protein